MNSFSAVKAGLAGYGLILRRPVSAAVWFLILLAFSVGYNAFATYMAGDAFQAIAEITAAAREGGAPPDTTSLLAATQQTTGLSLIAMVVQLGIMVFVVSAIVRAQLRPTPVGPAYLRAGGDELRLLVTMTVLFVITLLIMLGGGLVIALLAAVSATAGGRGAIPIGAAAGGVVCLAALAFISVKLCFAIPATMAQRQIRIFESWGLTKGRFWKIALAYLIALAALAPLAAATIFGAIGAAQASGGIEAAGGVREFLSYPPFTPEDLFSTARLAFYVLTTLLSVFVTATIYAVPTSIYQQIEGLDQAAAFDEDDDDDEDWDD